jgi:hypothetical protein
MKTEDFDDLPQNFDSITLEELKSLFLQER